MTGPVTGPRRTSVPLNCGVFFCFWASPTATLSSPLATSDTSISSKPLASNPRAVAGTWNWPLIVPGFPTLVAAIGIRS